MYNFTILSAAAGSAFGGSPVFDTIEEKVQGDDPLAAVQTAAAARTRGWGIEDLRELLSDRGQDAFYAAVVEEDGASVAFVRTYIDPEAPALVSSEYVKLGA